MATMSLQEKQAALDKIAGEIAVCKICRQGKVGLPVPGEGNPDAEVVFLGEAPGKQEAATGLPFIGRSGKVLRRLITGIGLREEEVFITSPVKYLPEYVTPTPKDVEHGCMHLFKQLDIIEPKIIVLLGRIACLAMLGRNVAIAKEHGRLVTQNGRTYLLTFHPASMLYSPKTKVLIEADVQQLKRLIKKK